MIAPGADRLPSRPTIVEVVIFLPILLLFPVVGLVVTRRRPGNAVGWLFLLVGFSMSATILGGEYAGRATYAGADLPGVEIAAWMAQPCGSSHSASPRHWQSRCSRTAGCRRPAGGRRPGC